ADQRMLFVVVFAVNVEDFLHVGHEAGTVSLGDAEPLRLPRLEPIFFRHLRTVSGQTLTTTLSRQSSSTSSFRVHRWYPAGGSLQHKVMSLASATPSSLGAMGGVARCFRCKQELKPSAAKRWRTRITCRSESPTFWAMCQSGLGDSPRRSSSARSRIRACLSWEAGVFPLRIRLWSSRRSSSVKTTSVLA